MYQDPQPSEAYYADEYAPYLSSYELYEQGTLFTFFKSLKNKLSAGRVSVPVQTNETTEDVQKVLDFGCGNGAWMQILKKYHPNWEVWGFDVDSNPIRDPQVLIGTYEDLLQKFPEKTFDKIYLGNVLEHLPRPLETLQMLYMLLKVDGEIRIDVPNIDSIKFKIFRNNFSSLELPRHLFHFNETTLRKMVEKAGFTFVSLSKSGSPKSIVRSIQYALGIRKERLSASGMFFVTKFLKMKHDEELNLVAKR